MILHRCDPPIAFDTELGPAVAIFVGADPAEGDAYWCCAIEETGELWWLPNHKVRLTPSITAGRYTTTPISPTPTMDRHRARHQRAPKG